MTYLTCAPSGLSLNINTDTGGNVIGANILATTVVPGWKYLANCKRKMIIFPLLFIRKITIIVQEFFCILGLPNHVSTCVFWSNVLRDIAKEELD